MAFILFGEKAAIIWRCRTFVLQPVRPGTRTPYSWMSREVCKSLERNGAYKPASRLTKSFPFSSPIAMPQLVPPRPIVSGCWQCYLELLQEDMQFLYFPLASFELVLE